MEIAVAVVGGGVSTVSVGRESPVVFAGAVVDTPNTVVSTAFSFALALAAFSFALALAIFVVCFVAADNVAVSFVSSLVSTGSVEDAPVAGFLSDSSAVLALSTSSCSLVVSCSTLVTTDRSETLTTRATASLRDCIPGGIVSSTGDGISKLRNKQTTRQSR